MLVRVLEPGIYLVTGDHQVAKHHRAFGIVDIIVRSAFQQNSVAVNLLAASGNQIRALPAGGIEVIGPLFAIDYSDSLTGWFPRGGGEAGLGEMAVPVPGIQAFNAGAVVDVAGIGEFPVQVAHSNFILFAEHPDEDLVQAAEFLGITFRSEFGLAVGKLGGDIHIAGKLAVQVHEQRLLQVEGFLVRKGDGKGLGAGDEQFAVVRKPASGTGRNALEQAVGWVQFVVKLARAGQVGRHQQTTNAQVFSFGKALQDKGSGAVVEPVIEARNQEQGVSENGF
ncbi:MAG: hypothetical protein BWX83_00530 [Candidatus Cloacimonetes bacterium ADurb.Bin117]|nr:MAG: hypothetical protein BWX83_00530 [Candidatus Cloacimonetes bacterium ADurb.Bin117]